MGRLPPIPGDLRALRERVAILANSSIDPTTLTIYRRTSIHFLTFCTIHQLQPDCPDALQLYVTYRSDRNHQPDQLLSHIGFCLTPLYPNFPKARENIVLRRVVKSIKRFAPSPKRKLALLTSHLLRLPPSTDHDSALFRALILAAFFGLIRLGEVTWPDTIARRWLHKVPLRCHVESGADWLSFRIIHKTDHLHEGATVRLHDLGLPYDPAVPMKDYLRWRDRRWTPGTATDRSWLFLTSEGEIPTRCWFMERFRLLEPDKRWSGHSLRAGGATWLAQAGVDESTIMRLGRWTSSAWERYIRVHPALMAVVAIQKERARRLRRAEEVAAAVAL